MFAPRSVVVRPSRLSLDVRCALCHSASSESATSCPKCRATFHPTCALELSLGVCPTIGCGARLAGARASGPRAVGQSHRPGFFPRSLESLVLGLFLSAVTAVSGIEVERCWRLLTEVAPAAAPGAGDVRPTLVSPPEVALPEPAPGESDSAPTTPPPLFTSSEPGAVSSSPLPEPAPEPAPVRAPRRARPDWAPSLPE